ncbi:D-aminoacyl-tRNA deacylase [Aequorivita sediminis]|uniref:D-aminoacyl-tRNA deacylase n=1 Tax=Aequorivita sediminis TaxID=3073653 RepID=UPI0028A8FB32|nr:D-aminoacyl-tRNA deacylase [Aequorivita sp. F6058]
MRALIQRVKKASVTIDGKIYSEINQGLLILLGIEAEDTQEDIEWLAAKIAKMRIFSDDNDAMNLSVQDVEGECLVVSQFTLHASTKKGNRPSFIKAARPGIAIPLYDEFILQLENNTNKKVKTGSFGAMMEVGLINDGPVTIWIDSKNKE